MLWPKKCANLIGSRTQTKTGNTFYNLKVALWRIYKGNLSDSGSDFISVSAQSIGAFSWRGALTETWQQCLLVVAAHYLLVFMRGLVR